MCTHARRLTPMEKSECFVERAPMTFKIKIYARLSSGAERFILRDVFSGNLNNMKYMHNAHTHIRMEHT